MGVADAEEEPEEEQQDKDRPQKRKPAPKAARIGFIHGLLCFSMIDRYPM